MRWSGLQQKVLLTFTILSVAAFIFIGFMGLRLGEFFLVRAKVREIGALYDDLALLLENARDGSQGRAFLLLLKRRDVKAYILRGRDGGILERWGSREGVSLLAGTGPMEGVSFPERSLLGMGDTMVYWGDVGGYRLGVLVSLRGLKEEIGYVRRVIIILILSYGLFLLVAGYLVMRYHVIGPLRKVEGLARKVSDGQLHLPVRVERGDEIGELASSIERMRVALLEKIESLERRNQEMAQMQDLVVHAEKMASIGRLASAIAHEIGNPLGAILGYVEILKDGDPQEAKEILERVGREIERLRETVGRLLELSRPFKGELRDVDVNRVVAETADFLKGTLKGIDLELILDEGLPHVRIDPRGLEQVLVNLMLNARDAMDGRGRLTIKTCVDEGGPSIFARRRKGDPPYLDFTHKRKIPPPLKGARRWVKIMVEDTGCGMDRQTMRQIFNPFFTTKAPGKGTGLGLAISLGIIQAFGGDIRVRSERGKGSTFEVLLPVW